MLCFVLRWGRYEGCEQQNRPPQLGWAGKESGQRRFQLRGWGWAGICREQRSLKHCTDWGSFETFPCPQKGDPTLKHLQASGSPPGTVSKTCSSSCCLCACSPPVALPWQRLKLLPLTFPPSAASDGQRQGAQGSHGSSQKHGDLPAQPLPGGWGAADPRCPSQRHCRAPAAGEQGLPWGRGAGTARCHAAEGAPAWSPAQGTSGFGPGVCCWLFTAVLLLQPGRVPHGVFLRTHRIPQACCSPSWSGRPALRKVRSDPCWGSQLFG